MSSSRAGGSHRLIDAVDRLQLYQIRNDANSRITGVYESSGEDYGTAYQISIWLRGHRLGDGTPRLPLLSMSEQCLRVLP